MSFLQAWWYNFFIAGIIGAGVGSFYLIHPALAIGLIGAIGYYIILDRVDEKYTGLNK